MTADPERRPEAAPVLETKRLLLRGHRLSDSEESAALWADPEVVLHISGVPATRQEAWSRLLRYAGHWALLGFGYWVVTAKSDGRFLGEVGFADYRRAIEPTIDGTPEAGWVFKTAEHGKGFAREAVARILAWSDGQPGFTRTVCIVAPENQASLMLARNMGFSAETRARFGSDPVLLLWRDTPGLA
ncbi:MAG: GNAT family N-acetyltransferase [Pseudomonadota bacterium]